MTTPVFEPATISSMSLSSICSISGLTTNSPFILPTFTLAMGPAKGISEISRAAEAPTMARVSGSLILSIERTVAITWVS